MADHVGASSSVDISRRGSRPRSKADGGRVPLVEWVRAAHRNGRRRRSWSGGGCGGSGEASSRWLLEAVDIAWGIAGCCRRARISDVRLESFIVAPKDEGESGDGFRDRSSGKVENSASWTVEFVAGASPGSGGGAVAPRRLLRHASEPMARLGLITEVSRSRSCGIVGEGDYMFPLGAVLYEVLSGKHPFDEGGGTGAVSTGNWPFKNLPPSVDTTAPAKKREKRLPNASPCTPLREFGLPSSLCDLVSSLLDPSDGSGHRYLSFDEVEDDLHRMIRDPDRFLFDLEPEAIPSLRKLEFPHDRLYGRDSHLSALEEAYERVLGSGSGEKGGGAREVVLLSGYSGTGKTSLMQRARGMFVSRGARFACGKFNKMCRGPWPLSAVFAAFDEYCIALLEGSEDAISAVRESIEAAIGCDSRVLTDLIPTLSKVIGEPSSLSVVAGGKEAHDRLRFIFCKFVRAISTPCHPVVLFLDDLQWADETSLELVQFLVADAENESFLVVGTYRDNEVGPDHPLTAQLQNMQEAGTDVTKIKVDDIDQKSVNDLISDTLHLLPRLTRPLTDVVYKKTNGNALFLSQLLRSLVDEGLLRFSLPSRRWEWDLDSIQSKAIADDVVELMMRKMLRLPQEVQRGLKIASCLGSACEESTLRLLEGMGGDDGESGVCQNIVHSVQVAVREGLMVEIPGGGARYKFSHDQIQHAAYSLIPECQREALHLRIGRLIGEEVRRRRRPAAPAAHDDNNEAEEVSLIFIAADQMNYGKNLITNRDERVGLARLNLGVGRKASSRSAFLLASVYLLEGVHLLDMDDWEHHYELCLELFSSCVEAQYVIANFTTIDPMLQIIFRRCRCIQDGVPAYYTLVKSLGAQGKVLDAIQVGLNVLSELGEYFPTEANPDVIQRDLFATRDELEGTTIDGILHKDNMRDGNKAAAMRFLGLISMYAFAATNELFLLLVFRMVRISLSHGVCREAAHGFASFGMILCAFDGDVKGGYGFGKLAISLLARFKAKECTSAVYAVVYGFINTYVEPIQAGLVSLTHGYEVGMLTGDIHWAMCNARLHVINAFQCGSKLESLANGVRSTTQQMKEYKQHMMLNNNLPYLQAMFNLMGSSKDPTQLTGEAMDQEAFLKKAVALRNWNAVSSVYFMRMWLGYLFGRYDIAAQMAEERLESTSAYGHCFRAGVLTETFYTGLVAAALARSEGQQKWRCLARNVRRKVKDWEQNSSWNFQHRVELLDAEIAFLDEDIDAAAKAYDKSIQSAGRHGFIHEQALACERAGLFSLELGNKLTAEEYFIRSRELYHSWGARRKADDLTKMLDNLKVS